MSIEPPLSHLKRSRPSAASIRRSLPRVRTAIYEIFVDRFAGAQGEQLQPAENGARPWHHHCGGSLHGVAKRVEHIQELGADAIYLTPVFPATSNHKYDASSYDHIDPRFGGDAAFDSLVDACRTRGLGLILDGVFNHVGVEHEWFQQAQAQKNGDRQDHFKWGDNQPGYACWRGHRNLPELNLSHPDVQHILFSGEDSVVRRWLRRGATGWRLDCANDLGIRNCARAARSIHKEQPEDGVVGEVMTYAEEWLQTAGLDGVMNYYFRETVLGLVLGEVAVVQAAYNLKRMAKRYPRESLLRSWNMLASHDTPRLASLVPDSARRHFAQVLSYVYPGIPMIYYGEEVGMLGGHDPDCRQPMQWENAQWHTPTFSLLKQLAAIRRSSPALLSGDYLPLPQPGYPGLLAFARTTQVPSQVIIVLANASDEPFEGRVFAPYSHLFDGLKMTDLLGSSETVHVSAGSVRAHLKPWQIALFTPVDDIPGYTFFRS